LPAPFFGLTEPVPRSPLGNFLVEQATKGVASLTAAVLVDAIGGSCQVRVYSGRGSGQVRTKTDEGQGQGAGQGVSPAGVGDRLDSTTKDNKH